MTSEPDLPTTEPTALARSATEPRHTLGRGDRPLVHLGHDTAEARAAAIAEIAWQHLLNRHAVAQALDELAAGAQGADHLVPASVDGPGGSASGSAGADAQTVSRSGSEG